MPDHVHMLLSVPPKHSVSSVMGFIKGNSAIRIARVHAGRRRNFVGQHFWARGDGDVSLWNLAEVEAVLKQVGLAP